MGYKKISSALKAEAVRLVVEAGHSPPEAARMMGIGPTALRRWVEQWRERQAAMPATSAEQTLLIEQLRAQLEASEKARASLAEERDVLKKQLPSHLAAILKPRRSFRR